MLLLSIDLGLARTGIAVGNTETGFAFPKTVINEKREGKLFEKICEIIKKENPERIVVGLPKNMDASEGERALYCRDLAEKISKATAVPFVMWDERLTTVAAYTALDETGTYGKKRKQSVDAVAAVIILESYMDYLKNNM